MVNPYLGQTCDQKRAALCALSDCYVNLMAGQAVVQIDDEGRTGVRYSKSDLPQLAALIRMLQADLGLLPNNGRRMAASIGYGAV